MAQYAEKPQTRNRVFKVETVTLDDLTRELGKSLDVIKMDAKALKRLFGRVCIKP